MVSRIKVHDVLGLMMLELVILELVILELVILVSKLGAYRWIIVCIEG